MENAEMMKVVPSIFVEEDFNENRLFFGFLLAPGIDLKEILDCFDKPEQCNYTEIDGAVFVYLIGTEKKTKEAIENLIDQVKDIGFMNVAEYLRSLTKTKCVLH